MILQKKNKTIPYGKLCNTKLKELLHNLKTETKTHIIIKIN